MAAVNDIVIIIYTTTGLFIPVPTCGSPDDEVISSFTYNFLELTMNPLETSNFLPVEYSESDKGRTEYSFKRLPSILKWGFSVTEVAPLNITER